MVSPCECGNEHSGSLKYGESFGYLRTCYLLRKGFAPCIYLDVAIGK